MDFGISIVEVVVNFVMSIITVMITMLMIIVMIKVAGRVRAGLMVIMIIMSVSVPVFSFKSDIVVRISIVGD